MQKLFRIVLSFLFVSGLGLSPLKAASPMTTGLTRKYGICFSSGDSIDIADINGSFIHFELKAGIGAVYDYFVKGRQHITGRVECYSEKVGEKEYVLEGFFNNISNARFRIVDMPDCDNLKAAILYYANEKEDPANTYMQYILIDEEYGQTPTIETTN